MFQTGHFQKLRHELRTYLNHIVGYADILVTDAQEFGKDEYHGELKAILRTAEKIRKLIGFFFTDDNDLLEIATPQDIRKAFYVPLVHIIGGARRMLVKFKPEESILARDMEQILLVSNQMLDLVETEIVELEIESLQNRPGTERPNTSGDNKDDRGSGGTLGDEADTAANAKSPGTPTGAPETTDLPDYRKFEAEIDDSLEGARTNIPGKILIVDDSPAVQTLLARNLAALGHETFTAGSGAEALQFLAGNLVDVVILDVLMPGLSGFQVLREMKRNPDLSDISVIMISGIDSSESIAQCIKLGAEDYLQKDFEPIILRARVEACMEKRILQKQQEFYLQAIVEGQEALARELNDAAEYISLLLPQPIRSDKIRTGKVFIPSAQLGGDFVGHHWLDHETLMIFVLDVSGHGIKSALLSVSLSNTLANQALAGVNFYDPGDVLTQLNNNYQQKSESNNFFTIWLGVYNIRTRVLKYSNGGSPPALLVQHGDKVSTVTQLNTRGILLGAEEDHIFQSQSIKLDPGSTLYVFSDGIFEIQRSNGKILGIQELEQLLLLLANDPQENLEELVHQAKALTMVEHFQDDITLFGMRIL